MFMNVFGNWLPHRVKNEVDPLAPSELRRRYEIGVTGHKDNLVYLPFEC